MNKILKFALSTSLSVLATSMLALTASAQNANFNLGGGDYGGINFGPNGPTGFLGSGGDTFRMGPNGFSGNVRTDNGNFRFNTNNGNFNFGGNGINFGGNFGGQPGFGSTDGFGGSMRAPGDGGSAYASQGDTGNQTNNNQRTGQGPNGMGGRFRSPEAFTDKQNYPIMEETSVNLLSEFSVDQAPLPSGSFSYGFNTSAPASVPYMGVRSSRSFPSFGGNLPRVSTGSVDINTVSP